MSGKSVRVGASRVLKWIGICCLAAGILATGAPAGAQVVYLDGCDIDFRQAANDTASSGLGHIEWINGILQSNNSQYLEGMSVPQRVILRDIPPAVGAVAALTAHNIEFNHQANKASAGAHGYDFLTSWDQAVAAANAIDPSGGLLDFLIADACTASGNADCATLRSSGNECVATVPDGVMDAFGLILGDSVDARSAAYEDVFGPRSVKLYGDAAFSSCTVTFLGYSTGSDKDALYRLSWISNSTKILIEMAGHLSVGPDNQAGPGIGYGAGKGSGAIPGGSWHFVIDDADYCNPGQLDNQIAALDILICTPESCDDENVCTDDECTATGCTHTNNTSPCDDGDPCTENDVCGGGTCQGTPKDCSFLDDQCKVGVCDPGTGNCVAQNTNEGGPCTDGDPCTEGDVCVSGVCTGTPKDCSFLNSACKVGVCNATTGVCEAIPANEGGPCDDGDNCTDTDVCTGGVCAGTPVDCSGFDDQCNQGKCDPATGNCFKEPANEGSGCDDGKVCTVGDVCVGGLCVGSPKDCSHLNDQCREGVCVEAAGGCIAMPINEGLPCDDGLFCNVGEVCIAGDCSNGGPRDCSDGIDCTDDFCDEVNDLCVYTPNNGFCLDVFFCNGTEFCDPNTTPPGTGCVSPGDPCSAPTKCDEPNDRCVRCTTDAQCDDGDFCTGLETCDTVTGFCRDGVDPNCDDGVGCTIDRCDETLNDCVNTPDNSQCPADANTCTDEFCHPTLGCVSVPVMDGTFCGDGTDTDCDNPDTCVAGVCVPNYEPLGTPCFDDQNECTVDVCDGSGNCTHNAVADDTPCTDDGNDCTRDVCIAGACTHPVLPDGTTCGNTTSKGPCDNPDQCLAGVCDRNLDPAGTLCRASAGICDVAEFCTGSSEICPLDVFQPSTLQCRAATGVCDRAEFCTGSAADCPPDTVIPATPPTVCRPSAGICDKPEACDGLSKDCPPDVFEPNTTVCRVSGGVCDVEEKCTGTGPNCPPDAVVPATPPTTCRPSAGDCDPPEVCDGVNKACPPNVLDPNTKVCRAACGFCDVPENCPGNGPNCPPDAFKPTSTECRASAGICDLPEFCAGSCNCPTDVFKPSSVICRPATNECDVDDHCPGSGPNCTLDVCQAATVTCTDDGDRCTDDHCDGGCACIHEDNNLCGACCLKDGSNECRDKVFREECPHPELKFFLKQRCIEINCFDVLIPTVSEWGLVVLTLVLLVGAKVYFGRRSEQAV